MIMNERKFKNELKDKIALIMHENWVVYLQNGKQSSLSLMQQTKHDIMKLLDE